MSGPSPRTVYSPHILSQVSRPVDASTALDLRTPWRAAAPVGREDRRVGPETDLPSAAGALWDGVCAVVPAGGAGRRLGGVDKPAVLVAGLPLLEHVLERLPPGVPVAVVGPERPVRRRRSVLSCREDPPGGGPAAAVAAGLDALERHGLLGRVVVVVPADAVRAAEALPRLLEALRGGAPGATAAVAVEEGRDGERHRQVLVAAHDATALRRRVAELGAEHGCLHGVAASRLLPAADHLVEVVAPADVLADVDTPEDLAAARAAHQVAHRAGGGGPA